MLYSSESLVMRIQLYSSFFGMIHPSYPFGASVMSFAREIKPLAVPPPRAVLLRLDAHINMSSRSDLKMLQYSHTMRTMTQSSLRAHTSAITPCTLHRLCSSNLVLNFYLSCFHAITPLSSFFFTRSFPFVLYPRQCTVPCRIFSSYDVCRFFLDAIYGTALALSPTPILCSCAWSLLIVDGHHTRYYTPLTAVYTKKTTPWPGPCFPPLIMHFVFSAHIATRSHTPLFCLCVEWL